MCRRNTILLLRRTQKSSTTTSSYTKPTNLYQKNCKRESFSGTDNGHKCPSCSDRRCVDHQVISKISGKEISTKFHRKQISLTSKMSQFQPRHRCPLQRHCRYPDHPVLIKNCMRRNLPSNCTGYRCSSRQNHCRVDHHVFIKHYSTTYSSTFRRHGCPWTGIFTIRATTFSLKTAPWVVRLYDNTSCPTSHLTQIILFKKM